MMKHRSIFLSISFAMATCFCISCDSTEQLNLQSPDGRLSVRLELLEKGLSYSIHKDGDNVIDQGHMDIFPSESPQGVLNQNSYKTSKQEEGKNRIEPHVYFKQTIEESYQSLELEFTDWKVEWRAYNDGLHYRLYYTGSEALQIMNESVQFAPQQNEMTWFPATDTTFMSFEKVYLTKAFEQLEDGLFAFLPQLFQNQQGYLLVTEADQWSYPGLFLQKEGSLLRSKFSKAPVVSLQEDNAEEPYRLEYQEYIAQVNGSRAFPWRSFIMVDQAKDLPTNTSVYRLAAPSAKDQDHSWIEPGMVVWDWWNANQLEGVPFEAGINTKTYEYYIDFAAEIGAPYVIIDDGWSAVEDLFQINPEMDMEKLVRYAADKEVKLILWCAWYALEKDWDKAFDQFRKWNIAGLKVDFFNRDDQTVLDWYEKLAKRSQKEKLMVNLHGVAKETGISRTYPNMITREGVLGLEHNKWSEDVSPEYSVTAPFIRGVAGPMDYTPGAMRNAAQGQFVIDFDKPMSQGTRAHQLAQYVVYFSPLQMLSDAPTAYQKEIEIPEIIASIPTVWDESKTLAGALGEYIISARKADANWYLAGLSNWEAKSHTLSLDFLEEGPSYSYTWVKDGPEAATKGTDHEILRGEIKKGEELEVNMAPGGGFLLILKKTSS